MPNQFLVQRLAGIQQILMGVYRAGVPMSSATKGQERAAFVDQFLAEVFPRPHRFGSGDATDRSGARSGQLDVVVEYPFCPTLPLGAGASRLYLAEGVAAVVEVKSNVAAQWSEILDTSNQLSTLTRAFGATMVIGRAPGARIPLFVAGYSGWKQVDTIQQHLQAAANVSGVLIVDNGLFVSQPDFGGITATGPLALWGLITSLYQCVASLQAAVNDPIGYAI
jgi:hypothetical protein